MEDGEVCFLVRISVGIIESHPMTGQDLKGGSAKAVGQFVSFRLAFVRVAAPARSIVPFVSSASCIHVDGNQADVPAAHLGANAVDSFTAFGEWDIFVFWNQRGRVEAPALEFIIDTAGDFARVGPFKETAVRRALSCSFPAVSVVD